MKLEITVSNVPLPYSLTASAESAIHAHQDISITKPQEDVNAKSHAPNLEQSTQKLNNANALLTKREIEEYSTLVQTPANAHQNSPFGTEDIVLYAQLEPNSTPKNTNAITAQKVSSETLLITHVSPDCESQNDRFIRIFKQFFFWYSNFF